MLATAAAPPAANRAFMVGKWSADDGNCAKVIHLHRDGRADTPYGKATWSMAGNRLTVHGGPGGAIPYRSTITALDRNRVRIVTDWGDVETQRRC